MLKSKVPWIKTFQCEDGHGHGQGAGKMKRMTHLDHSRMAKVFLRCCSEDGYGYGAGGGEDDHYGYQGIAALMVCE